MLCVHIPRYTRVSRELECVYVLVYTHGIVSVTHLVPCTMKIFSVYYEKWSFNQYCRRVYRAPARHLESGGCLGVTKFSTAVLDLVHLVAVRSRSKFLNLLVDLMLALGVTREICSTVTSTVLTEFDKGYTRQ
jgi:hypothetical protein